MKITPVKHYNEPAFPVRTVVDDHPELLHLVPKRWQANPVVLTALTAASVLLSSCSYANDKITKGTSRVAPVFKHGDGQAFFGGDMSSIAIMLSEDDARQIITNEAKRYGISFLPIANTLTNVPVPDTTQRDSKQGRTPDNNSVTSKPKQTMSLELDGTDKKQKISFEFVSESDLDEWQKKNGIEPYTSTVTFFNFLNTAENLQKILKTRKPVGTYAVFYDPTVGQKNPEYIKKPSGGTDHEAMDAASKKARTEALENAREQLRLQVKDFVKWLKTQGVI